jgi:hypothetical protein
MTAKEEGIGNEVVTWIVETSLNDLGAVSRIC